jgi:hypothetical protein
LLLRIDAAEGSASTKSRDWENFFLSALMAGVVITVSPTGWLWTMRILRGLLIGFHCFQKAEKHAKSFLKNSPTVSTTESTNTVWLE